MAGLLPTPQVCAQFKDQDGPLAFVGMDEVFFRHVITHLGASSRCREIASIPRTTWDGAVGAWQPPPGRAGVVLTWSGQSGVGHVV